MNASAALNFALNAFSPHLFAQKFESQTEEESLAALEHLMEEFFTHSTSNSRKHDIEAQLNTFSNQRDCWKLCVYFLTHTSSQYVSMYALSTIESVINRQWVTLEWEHRVQLKSALYNYLIEQDVTAPHFLRNKLAKLIVDIARFDWPHFFPEFLSNTIQVCKTFVATPSHCQSLQLLQSSEGQLLGLVMLHITSEEFMNSRPDLSSYRKEELTKLLQQNIPQIFQILCTILESVGIKPRHGATATPPPSPTQPGSAPDLTRELIAASFRPDNKFITRECLSTIQHLFTWANLTAIPLALIKNIFYFTNISTYAQDDDDMCVLAMSALNELFYRKCTPPGTQNLFTELYHHTVQLLRDIVCPNSTRIETLGNDFVDKLSELLALLVEQHLWRLETEPGFSALEFLSLLYQLTIQLPSLQCYLRCLAVWAAFIKQLKPQNTHKYSQALLGLISVVLNKMQFTYNLPQLDEIDNESNNDDESEWKVFLKTSVEVIAMIAEYAPTETFNEVCMFYAFSHSQTLAALKTWMPWIPLNNEIMSTRLKELLDVTLPLLRCGTQYPGKTTHSASHLFLSLSNTVFPPSLIILPTVVEFLHSTPTLRFNGNHTREVINNAVCTILVRPWGELSHSDTVHRNALINTFFDGLTREFKELGPHSHENRVKEVVATTLPLLSHIIEYGKEFPSQSKKLLYMGLKSSIDTGLQIFSSYPAITEVSDHILTLFLNVLNVLQQQEIEPSENIRLHSILKDVSSLTQTLARLSTLFTDKDNDYYKSSAPIIDSLVHSLIKSASAATNSKFYLLKSKLLDDFAEVHSQTLAALKTWMPWIPLNNEIMSTRLKELLDVTLPLLRCGTQYPGKTTHSASHLFLSLSNTVFPPSLIILPTVVEFLHSTPTLRFNGNHTREVINNAVCTILVRPWGELSHSDTVHRNALINTFFDGLTREFKELGPHSHENRVKEVVATTLPLLSHIIEYGKEFPSQSKKLLYMGLKSSIDTGLQIFSSYPAITEVSDHILTLFLNVLNVLQQQLGVENTKHAIEVFLDVAVSQQQSKNLSGLDKLLQILQIVIEFPGSSYKSFLPGILQLCMQHVYPLVICQANEQPDLIIALLTLLHSILVHRWQYFYMSQVRLGHSPGCSETEPGPDSPQQPAQLLAVLQVFGQALLQPDINVFRTSLLALEDLHSKWKLYQKMLFRQQLLNQFLTVLCHSLLDQSHAIFTDDILLAIYNMAAVNFQTFFDAFLIEFLQNSDGLSSSQRNSLKHSFNQEMDMPTFIQNFQRFINDLRCYRLCNMSIPLDIFSVICTYHRFTSVRDKIGNNYLCLIETVLLTLSSAKWKSPLKRFDTIVNDENTKEAILSKVSGVSAIFWSTRIRLDGDIMDAAGSQLEVVSTMAAGLDNIDVQELKKRNIKLSNTPGVLNSAVADVAVMLTLAASRRLHEGRLHIENGTWTINQFWMLGQELSGSTVGIVGFGGIGQEIVRKLTVFDVKQFLYCGHKERLEGNIYGAKFVTFDTLLRTSDVVVVACPLTRETNKMFNEQAFAKMKKTSVFVNIARGAIVDQPALIKSLKENTIFAAGLDVMMPEPLPNDNELLTLPNCGFTDSQVFEKLITIITDRNGVAEVIKRKMEKLFKKVFIVSNDLPQSAVDLLRSKFDTIVDDEITKEAILSKVGGVSAIFWSTKLRLDGDIIAAAGPQLEVVSIMAVGFDNIDVQELKKRNIKLSNTPGVINSAVADVAVMLTLAASRRLHEGRLHIENGTWNFGRLWMLGQELSGSTVGIVGFGGIGQEIVRKLTVFDVKQFLYCGHKERLEGNVYGAKFVTFDTLLRTSDFVVVACPLSRETYNMFNDEAFATMKKTSVFVNVGRGAIVDQPALIKALRENSIFAAGLDVMMPEPLPNYNELLTLPNCEYNRKRCVNTTILSFHGNYSRDVLPEGIQNPFVLVDVSKNIIRDRSYNIYEELVILHFEDVNFKLMLEYGLQKLHTLSDTYDFNLEKDSIRLFTNDPQHPFNQCGRALNFVEEHTCKGAQTIKFPTILRSYSDCNITYDSWLPLKKIKHQTYDFNLEKDSIQLFTNDPQHPFNQCGRALNFVEEHTCKGAQTIKFPTILRSYSDCNITYDSWLPLKKIKHQSQLLFIKKFIFETVEKYNLYFGKEDNQNNTLYNRIRNKMVLVHLSNYFATLYNSSTFKTASVFMLMDDVHCFLDKIQSLISVDSSLTGAPKVTFKSRCGFYMIHSINKILTALFESGLIKYNQNFYKTLAKNKTVQSTKMETVEDTVVLTLHHLYPVFVFWGISLSIAVRRFFAELFVSYRKT
ncbi:hypothetical protein FQA39_LY03310 [Lamprigera yunnana]|nr:hypothetical protein FQA39_LY03310 [Lamprigera yunnana]